jgi:hypothetical protein
MHTTPPGVFMRRVNLVSLAVLFVVACGPTELELDDLSFDDIDMSGLVDLHANASFENGTTGFSCHQCELTAVELADAPSGRFVGNVVGRASDFSLGDWPGVARVSAGHLVKTQVTVRSQGQAKHRRGKICLRERNLSGTFVATTCGKAFTFGEKFHAVGASHLSVGQGIVEAYVYMAGAQIGDSFLADDFKIAIGGGAETSDAGVSTPDAGVVAPDAGSTTPDAGSLSSPVGEISAANQAVISFPPNSPSQSTLTAYAQPGGLLVLDPYLLGLMANGGRDLIRELRAAGAEVLLYINVMEVPDFGVSDISRLQMFDCQSGASCASTMPTNYFFPHSVNGSLVKLSNWPNTYLTDVTQGSAFSNNVVSFLGSWDRLGANGYFLDVIGSRLWTGAWDAMPSTERTAWSSGVYDIVSRLRAAMGENVLLMANNVWDNGHPALNGFCVEHHDVSQSAFFSGLMLNKPWHTGRRHLVIANGATQAQQWRSVPGVTHITPQQDYSQQPLPLASWAFTAPR